VSVRLFALGALMEGKAHGYDLIEKGRLWGLEAWSAVSVSSIYHALRTMAGESLIEEAGREREDGKPERVMYRITPAGKRAFAELMAEAAEVVGTAKDPFYLVLAFASRLGAGERGRLINRRKALLEAQRAALGEKLEYMEGHPDADYWSKAAVDLNLRRIAADLEWLAGIDPAQR
jgi:DNA-binding PadR family transcriptional regulator